MFTFTDPVVAGTVLVRPAIQSPNYVPNVSGWAIFANGTAEFNDVIIGVGEAGYLLVASGGQIDLAGLQILTGALGPPSGNIQVQAAGPVDIDAGFIYQVPAVASEPGTVDTAETWHPLTLSSSKITNQTGGAKLSARVTIENEVELQGVINLAAGWANPIATLGAGYIPPGSGAVAAGFPVGTFGAALTGGAPYLSVAGQGNANAGQVSLTNVPAATTAVVINGRFALGIQTA